ncbi:penicillin-binding transpeptidase domain-containing protein [Gordonia polyisoprenivorans]|uniref:penicillin-binding transpeptidase domain-containing protein n=1 Tax=Gordonia polyisoprenivorans TaxID=84595 RepID=UPI0023006891|nr:penicillin-binding transpeptidase domain-containing protein [Gordonia polyisoprenivorans]WCB37697.1 penicillin-binding transpeptidase domain-containing protein [Gordonia polyisoprenivorans]
MRRSWTLLCVGLLLIGVLGTATACFGDDDSPDAVLSRFANALHDRTITHAADLTDNPTAARSALTSVFDGVGRKALLAVDARIIDDKQVTGTLHYRWDFGGGRTTDYESTVLLVQQESGWRVSWAPTVLHPDLRAGQTFSFSEDRAYRTPVEDRHNLPLLTWQTVSVVSLSRDSIGSAQRLAQALRPIEPSMTGQGIRALFDGNTTARQSVIRLRQTDMARVGPQLRAIPGVSISEQGDLLSASRALRSPAMNGLEDIWRQTIDTTAGWSLSIVNPDGSAAQVISQTDPRTTSPIVTTLDRDIQTHAQEAVDSENKPTVIVALQPSTGGILAVAQNAAADTSGPIALSGLYPPGSTFKTITTAAALEAGLVNPSTPLGCPGRATIQGRTIPNENDFDLGTVSLTSAFAHSCNTTMGALANRLPATALTTTARTFGIGADYDIPGITTVTGDVPNADTPALRVENGIGQGKVTVSPFGLAVAEVSLAQGKTVTPQLVRGRRTTGDTGEERIPPNVVADLREMMRATVTDGTATALRDIAGLGGKTGTAEYGDNRNPHGWFAGIVGDLAFATLVVGGGSSDPAVNVSGEFLRPLRTR